uniref:Uncharacterized protein n=1 Tax=Picea glauca TaxID=3330 RepID=A0A101LW32_PICGL|nr:hypothetical protein ABT39_MTgene1734 [Picea glauca]KUM48744.1 hypothetical protein ABT39_MTgene4759 [Picea glauca]QHR89628.1 hypothetical protein Q903MT_gene3650 [Picea sitchensis]
MNELANSYEPRVGRNNLKHRAVYLPGWDNKSIPDRRTFSLSPDRPKMTGYKICMNGRISHLEGRINWTLKDFSLFPSI